jgi:hypothetical protein
MFAFLQHIPPVANAVRRTFTPPFPLPPVPFPDIGDGDPVHDPDNAERGLRIPQFFSSPATDPHFDTFLFRFTATVARLTPEARARVGRGSYLVNALADCNSCHTDGNGDGIFDGGLLPRTADVNTAAYLAGGVDLGFVVGTAILSRNLTPDPDSGMFLSREQFSQTLQFGADFRRPGHSLRVASHFPVEFHFTQEDLRAVYAYLQAIPAVRHAVEIVP